MNITHLSLSWSISRGRDTYGYNICRLDDRTTGKRYRCMGGGYDMIGTVFGDWLQDTRQDALRTLYADHCDQFTAYTEAIPHWRNHPDFYSMMWNVKEGRMILDGACGLDCMIKIAEAIGLEVEREYQKRGRNRGQTLGWYVSPKAT